MNKESLNPEYPRVLVINSYPFWQGTATGLTLISLFRGWPKDKLACIYTSISTGLDRSICKHYWKLSLGDMRCVRCILGNRLLAEKDKVTCIEHRRLVLPKSSDVGKENSFVSFVMRIKRRIPRQGLRDLDIYRIPPYMMKNISDFRPEVIYSMLASNPLLRLVYSVAKQYSIPIVPHFMDDWPTTIYKGSILRSHLRKNMLKNLNKVFDMSPRRMVIGKAMAEEYTMRYRRDFIPFMNAVEPGILNQTVLLPKKSRNVRLTYIGGLHLNRWRSLQDIGRALKELWAEGIAVEALVYTRPQFAPKAKHLNIPPVMRYAGFVTPSEVPNILREANVVLHVESFDRDNRAITRYSLSTKITECMASSRPIFAYGPEEIASIRYVRESGCGLTVGRRNHAELVAALRKLSMSEQLREKYGKQGLFIAESRHNAVVQREQFRTMLLAASENTV